MIERIIPRPEADVAQMRTSFTQMVSQQWRTYVHSALGGCETGQASCQFAKGRFIGEMYARACYSMLLVSRNGPRLLSVPVSASSILPQSRKLTIQLGSALLRCMRHLLPKTLHRQVLLTSALMGMLDVLLDDAACSNEAALRVASLTTQPSPAKLLPAEEVIVTLRRAARQTETAWQSEYWRQVVQPAVRKYCLAEVLAVEGTPDPTGMGHRWAGIDAAIKGMWYVIGPFMGIQDDPSMFEETSLNREQQWMADTTLLMQMIDDWVDQDEDRGARLTPVVTGEWTLESIAQVFDKTIRDLNVLLDSSGIRKPVLKSIFADLYTDYLHTAMEAMRTGTAA